MNSNYYLILCSIGILVAVLCLFYTISEQGKFFETEDLIYLKPDSKVMFPGLVKFALLIVSSVAIFSSFHFLIGVLTGILPTDSEAEIKKLMIPALTFSIIIPLLIFTILSVRKTKRLLNEGHKLAGYLSSKVNPRFNLLQLQMTFLSVSLIGLHYIIIGAFFPMPEEPVEPNIVLGLIYLSPYFFWIPYVLLLERIVYFLMKKILGESVNMDYSFPIMEAKKKGISEEDFYKIMFTKLHLKMLEKEINKRKEK